MRATEVQAGALRRRRRLVALLVLGVLVVAGGIVHWQRDRAQNERTLADGSVVILRGVSYGTKHWMMTGPPWRRVLTHVLPQRWAVKYGAAISGYTNGTPLFVVWVEHVERFATNQTNANVAGSPRVTAPFPRYVLTDDAGTCFTELWGLVGATTPRGRLVAVSFPPPSRSSRDLHFQFLPDQPAGEKPLSALFTVSNPMFDPAWSPGPTPYPYPITVKTDGVVFVLHKLARTMSVDWGDPRLPLAPETRVDVTLTNEAGPQAQWLPAEVDIVGGGVVPVYVRPVVVPQVRLLCGLSTNEASTLRFTFRGGAPSLSYTAHDVPVWGSGTVFQPLRIPWAGSTLVLKGFIAPNVVSAAMDPPDPRLALSLRRVVAAGEVNLPIESLASSNLGDCAATLWSAPSQSKVDLTFELERKLIIDVTAQPVAE